MLAKMNTTKHQILYSINVNNKLFCGKMRENVGNAIMQQIIFWIKSLLNPTLLIKFNYIILLNGFALITIEACSDVANSKA